MDGRFARMCTGGGKWRSGKCANRFLRMALPAAVAFITGCAHQTPVPDVAKPPVNLSGYSAPFREGFSDGCETARGHRKRNEARYVEDAQYGRGWDDGRAICARK